MNANIFFSLLRILLSGTSLGIFLFVQSLPVTLTFTDGASVPKLLWGLSSPSRFWSVLALTNLALLMVWQLYSFFQSKFSARSFSETAARDSYSYLPFTFLLLSLAQFNGFLTSYFEGLLLFSQWAQGVTLLLALLGVVYLKSRLHSFPRRATRTFAKTSSFSPGIKTCGILFLCAFSLYTVVSDRVKEKLPLGGDEPHYLLIMHSLLHDRDLAIGNNYRARDYGSFYRGHLSSHVSIARDQTRYSIHPVGMPVLLLPFYAVKGYPGALVGMNLIAAGLSVLLFLIAHSHIQQLKISLLLWGLVSFTPPLIVYSSQMYPEVPSALFLAWAYYLISTRAYSRKGGLFMLCLLLAGLPWLQSRMILATVLLFCYHVYSFWKESHARSLKNMTRLELLLPAISLAVSGILMAVENFVRFHSIFPNASYQSIGIESVFSWSILFKEGALGLLFDQEAGLFIYAPYFMISLIGALFLWKKERSKLIFCMLFIAAIYIPCAGFTLRWRGAWSPAARYMVAQLPFWCILLAAGTKYALRHTFSRYAFLYCSVLSIGWTVRFLENPISIIMRSIGVNRYFEEESLFLKLPQYFPAFTPQASGSYLLVALWLTMIITFSCYVYYRSTPTGRLSASPQNSFRKSVGTHQKAAVQSLFGIYAILLLCSILWAFLAIDPGHPMSPSRQQRAEFFNFFTQLRFDNILSNARLPVSNDRVTFNFSSRPKKATPNQSGRRFVVSGPREPFVQGKYTAIFDVILKKPGDGTKAIAELEVVARRGKQRFTAHSLFEKDFPTLKQRVRFFVPFKLPADVADLETRVFYLNHGEIEVTQVSVVTSEQEFYYQAGLRAIQQNRFTLAQNLLNSVERDQYPMSAYYLALVEQHNARWAESLQLLDSAIHDTPNFADAFYRQGVAYINLQQWEHAEHAFLTADSLQSNHQDALRALRQLYLQQDRQEAAEEMTQRLEQ